MKYAYEDLGDDQFEELVVLLCRRLLGMGTQGFAKGIDGGRDGKFVGKAQLIPSMIAPWEGIVIVQAKHTRQPALSIRRFQQDGFGARTAGELPRELFDLQTVEFGFPFHADFWDAAEIDRGQTFQNPLPSGGPPFIKVLPTTDPQR